MGEMICACNMREYPVCDVCPNLRRLRPRRMYFVSTWPYKAKYREYKKQAKFRPDESQRVD